MGAAFSVGYCSGQTTLEDDDVLMSLMGMTIEIPLHNSGSSIAGLLDLTSSTLIFLPRCPFFCAPDKHGLLQTAVPLSSFSGRFIRQMNEAGSDSQLALLPPGQEGIPVDPAAQAGSTRELLVSLPSRTFFIY